MSFISRMKAQELNLPQAEFDSYMSGEAIPPGSWEASLLMCEGIQTMSQNLKVSKPPYRREEADTHSI